jgi:hypothetical protein
MLSFLCGSILLQPRLNQSQSLYEVSTLPSSVSSSLLLRGFPLPVGDSIFVFSFNSVVYAVDYFVCSSLATDSVTYLVCNYLLFHSLLLHHQNLLLREVVEFVQLFFHVSRFPLRRPTKYG